MITSTIRRTAGTVAALGLASLAFAAGWAQGSTAECLGRPATIQGDVGDNTIYGTEGDDVIVADAGNDVVYALGGNDVVCGGPDIDAVNGGAGNDLLVGGDGAADQAQYWNAPGAVIASLANGYADGAAGRDTLVAFERLVGSAYDDTLIGDAGSNSFIGLEGDDLIDGGPGVDSVKYNWRLDPVVVDLLSGTATGQGRDSLRAVESIVGTQSSDTISGDGFANTLSGLGGSDVIDGLDGNDVLEGGPDRDDLRGGYGADKLFGEEGDDVLDGGSGYDGLGGPLDGGDVLSGGTGTDWATYRSHVYSVSLSIDGSANDGVASHGENDNVMPDVEDLTGTRFGDLLIGSDSPNRIFGTEGDDVILGQGGDDSLVGEAGSDWLYGEAGSDTLYARHSDADHRIDCGVDGDTAYRDSIDPAPISCETLP
jgi:Ca2+-binding RTX toxin-like protein